MTKREIEKRLRKAGFELKPGARHDIWVKAGLPVIVVPRHRGDIPLGTARRILKDAGLAPD